MLPNTIAPTKILHYAYLNVKFFSIDFPPENVVLCRHRKLNHLNFHGLLIPSECFFFLLNFMPFLYQRCCRSIDLRLSNNSNKQHQKLCTIALVIRRSNLASVVLYIWQQIATDLMFLNAMTYLKLLSLNIAFRNYLM